MSRLRKHFIISFVNEVSNLNGTDFEYLCKPVFSLITNEDILHKGHNLYAKPVGYTSDLIIDKIKYFGQCGTESDYFEDLEKPIHDIERSLGNHKSCERIYLFANRRATGGQLTKLNIEIKARWQNLTVEIFDAERIANIILDNIHNTTKIEEVLHFLPKTFEYYRILPQTNKLPSFKTKYYKREEEDDIIKKLKTQNYIQIYGISGIGKTEISISIGNQLKNNFDSVLWINGDILNNDKVNLSSIQISKFNNSLNLEYFLQEYKILIIVDNLNNNVSEFIKLFEESNRKDSVCIISSLQRNLSEKESFELSFINDDIAKNILLDTQHKPTQKQIDFIVKEIQGYPLVLSLIKSSIEVDDLTWDEIIEEINKLKDFPDDKNQKLSQRIIGKFINLLEKELQLIKCLDNRKISRHFLLNVLGKKSIVELEKRSLIHIQDLFYYDTHQLILDSIKSEIKSIDDSFIKNSLETYLKENNEIKSVEYYKFLLTHKEFVRNIYDTLQFDDNLKKIILYALIQSTDSFNSPEWFIRELNLIEYNIRSEYYDLLLFIEKAEIELFQIDKKSDNYKSKCNNIIDELNSVLSKTSNTNFKIVLYHHIGKFYLKNKDSKHAIKYFQEVLSLDNNADYSRLQLARIYLNDKNIENVTKEIDYIFSKDIDIHNTSLSILLSFFELLARNDLSKLRSKYIDKKIDLFIKVIINSLDSNFEQPYMVIEKLSSYLSYMLKDIYNDICEALHLPSNIEGNERLRFAFAKIKLSQYKMLKYSTAPDEEEMKMIAEISEKYFKTINFKNDYERKQLIDLYISSEQYEKALNFTNDFENKEDPFYYQIICKIQRGLKRFSEALSSIDNAIKKSDNLNDFYLAAFLNDKAETLYELNDKKCIDILQEAIEKQNNAKTIETWKSKKEKWIQELK